MNALQEIENTSPDPTATTEDVSLNDIEMGIQQVRGLLEDVLRKQDENMTSLAEQTRLIQETIKNLLVSSSANIPTTAYTHHSDTYGAASYIQRIRLS